MTPPLLHQLLPKTNAQLQLILEQKRAFLSNHPASKNFLFEPSRLWGLIVEYRYIPQHLVGLDGSAVNEYDDLRLSFADYKKIAYIILFGEGDVSLSGEKSVVAHTESLTEEEKEIIFFKHPFLSPKTFLMFERSVDNFDQSNNTNTSAPKTSFRYPETVSAVPLYTYVAKKMLLFRMRVMLELVASVPPPSLKLVSDEGQDGGTSSMLSSIGSGKARCAPSPSSPLSNGLTQEDVEAFIKQLVPHIRLVRDMPRWLLPYYLCHASRKIMFMLDPRGTGAVSIEALMMSDVFSEFIRMYESEVRDAVVTFPIGCALEILPETVLEWAAKQHASGVGPQLSKANANMKATLKEYAPDWVVRASESGDEDLHLSCSVENYENEGNDPADMYTVTVVCPKEYRDPETGVVEVFTLLVPRGGLVWCPSTTGYISPELSAITNWFSLPLMYRIYEHFTVLDADADGVLSLEEFSNYSNGSYTPLASRRVFEVHVREAGGRHAMDFKHYLNFVVATEHVNTPQGRKYLWEVLDLEHTRDYISVNALRCFCKELSAKLAENNLMRITSDSILSEVIDMINPAWHERVTRADVEKSRQHHTVIPILLSHRNFYAYDCREQSAAQPSSNEYV